MLDDLQINGGRKVTRKPSLSAYDNRKPPSPAADPAYAAVFSTRFDRDAASTRARDKAELVAFGVNGEVPLAQALVNAKDKWRYPWGVMMSLDLASNDNTKSAAEAA